MAEIFKRIGNPSSFLSNITCKTGFLESQNQNANVNFEGLNSIINSEIANLRRYCLNFVVLKYFIRTKGRQLGADHVLVAKNSQLMPNVMQVIRTINQNEDLTAAKNLSRQLKLKSRNIVKILCTYVLPVAHVRFPLLSCLLFLAEEFPLSFLFGMIVEHAFQQMFADSCLASVMLGFIHVMVGLNQNSTVLECDSSERISEDTLIYFKKQSWKQNDWNVLLAATEFRLTFIDQSSSQKTLASETRALMHLFLPFSSDFMFDRILKLSFFIRKYLLCLVVSAENLSEVEMVLTRLVTWPKGHTKSMPLKLFVSISKTILCFLNYKLETGTDRPASSWFKNCPIFEKYLTFSLEFFSHDFHFVYKNETEYSLSEFDSYDKLVIDMHSIFLALQKFSLFAFQNNNVFEKIGVSSFFNRFVGNLSGISRSLKLTPVVYYFSNVKRIEKLVVQPILHGCLFFLKNKIDSLRAKMYFNYLNIKMNPIFDDFRISNDSFKEIFENVFEVNPISAVFLQKLCINKIEN